MEFVDIKLVQSLAWIATRNFATFVYLIKKKFVLLKKLAFDRQLSFVKNDYAPGHLRQRDILV